MLSLMPEDSWIGLTDHDAMFLRPDSKAQIARCVAEGKFDVFGPLTNRLWGDHQRYNGVFSDNGDINHHLNIANLCHHSDYGVVEEPPINVPGLCVVFNKAPWQRVGGFTEGSICLDKEFTDAVMATGGRLGIMKGVYMFHLYRWSQDQPGQYTKHLL